MKNFISKNAKIIYLLCGVLSFLTLMLGLVFMTQYRYIRVNYLIGADNQIEILETAQLNGKDQTALYSFINRLGNNNPSNGRNSYVGLEAYENSPELQQFKENYIVQAEDGTYVLKDEALMEVYNYKNKLDTFNNLIIVFSAISLVMFALMFVLSNHSRRIFYKSNLIGGIILSGIIAVLNIVLIGYSIALMVEMNQNYMLFNIVSVLQNPSNVLYSRPAKSTETLNNYLQSILNGFDVNLTTFVLYDLLFGLVLAYNVFLAVFAVLKYKWTAERRKEVIENSKIVGELV